MNVYAYLCIGCGSQYQRLCVLGGVMNARVCSCAYCSKCSSVIRLTISAPDTGLRVTPMIPPRNSLAVGGVVTCTVASPQ